MAWYDWFTPLSVGAVGQPAENQATYLNLLLPFLNPYERADAARVLRASASGDVQQAIGDRYQFDPGTARSEQEWLAGLGGLSTAMNTPRFALSQPRTSVKSGTADPAQAALSAWQRELESLEGDPNLEWFRSLGEIAASMSPNMTRQQQRDAKYRWENWMNDAPEEMQGVGSFLMNPYLDRPQYGAAATFGTYRAPYQVKGGLVANPWYV